MQAHYSVMLRETMQILQNCTKVIDATFGRGGHSKGLLDLGIKVTALDRDAEAMKRASELQVEYPGFAFYNKLFSEIGSLLPGHDGVLFDFGLSTPQIHSDRGFSFDQDDFLDMGMGLHDTTASHIINHYSQEALADLFFYHGDERLARVYAKRIVELRRQEPITRMSQLLSIFPKRTWQKIHPATKVLQAIRIEVNRELEQIEKAMESIELYKNGLTMVCISFHSGEDRIIKNLFKKWKPDLLDYSKKPLAPTREEVLENPASRSAKLRWCRFK